MSTNSQLQSYLNFRDRSRSTLSFQLPTFLVIFVLGISHLAIRCQFSRDEACSRFCLSIGANKLRGRARHSLPPELSETRCTTTDLSIAQLHDLHHQLDTSLSRFTHALSLTTVTTSQHISFSPIIDSRHVRTELRHSLIHDGFH